jgi:hypothetical protein
MTASSRQLTQGQARPRLVEDSVNGALTPKRRRPVTENSEYAAFARRILRAYSRRIAIGDVESLTHLIDLADDINDAIHQSVEGLRAAGYSWAEIGTRLNISRQAAQQRWGRRSSRSTPPIGSTAADQIPMSCNRSSAENQQVNPSVLGGRNLVR